MKEPGHIAQCHCGWKKEYKNEAQANRGLSMHERRMHSKPKKKKANAVKLSPNNMNVQICPRCHCRFATMIID